MMTKMLREHYNIIAGALHRAKPPTLPGVTGYVDQLKLWEAIVKSVGNALRQTNPRFDYDLFCEVCQNGVKS